MTIIVSLKRCQCRRNFRLLKKMFKSDSIFFFLTYMFFKRNNNIYIYIEGERDVEKRHCYVKFHVFISFLYFIKRCIFRFLKKIYFLWIFIQICTCISYRIMYYVLCTYISQRIMYYVHTYLNV